MTVEEFEVWLKEAWSKAEKGGESIGQYTVFAGDMPLEELVVDHRHQIVSFN